MTTIDRINNAAILITAVIFALTLLPELPAFLAELPPLLPV